MANILKAKVLNNPNLRRKANAVDLAVAERESTFTMYWSSENNSLPVIEKGKYLMILNGEIDNSRFTVNIGTKSKIFPTTPFPLKDGLEENFFHAPQIPLSQVLSSRKRSRVSVEATVKVISLKSGDSWVRKDVTLQDIDQQKVTTVTCKLWNKSADLVGDRHTNKRMRFENIEIDEFNGRVSLKNTSETTAKLVDNEKETKCSMQILAASPSTAAGETSLLVIIDDEQDATEVTVKTECLPEMDLPQTLEGHLLLHEKRVIDFEE